MDKSNYTEGYYIVFDYNKTPNVVMKERGEIFDTKYQGKLIHVVFVKMNAVRPSQIYKEEKRASKTAKQK